MERRVSKTQEPLFKSPYGKNDNISPCICRAANFWRPDISSFERVGALGPKEKSGKHFGKEILEILVFKHSHPYSSLCTCLLSSRISFLDPTDDRKLGPAELYTGRFRVLMAQLSLHLQPSSNLIGGPRRLIIWLISKFRIGL